MCRKYAERRVKSRFQENKTIADPLTIRKEYSEGHKALGMLKRQVKNFKLEV